MREICVIKSVGLACSGKEIYHFCFVLLCIRGQIPSTSPPGGLYLEGRFNGGFFALPVWGAYIWRGLFSEFYGIFVGKVLLSDFKFSVELEEGFAVFGCVLALITTFLCSNPPTGSTFLLSSVATVK